MELSDSTVALIDLYRLAEIDPKAALDRLAELDGEFISNIHYEAFRPGVIINSGIALGNKSIILKGVDFLENILASNDRRLDDWRGNLCYNLGNGYYELLTLERREQRDPDSKLLQETKRAYRIALEVSKREDTALRAEILVNYGNTLSYCGRHYEALLAYDQALHHDPKHSMALGNKGIELARYSRLASNNSGLMLAEAFELCDAASADTALDTKGLASARGIFTAHRDALSAAYDDCGELLAEARSRQPSKSMRTREEEIHHRFAVENGLYLNLCVHEWPCAEQHFDTLFFSYVTPLSDLDLFPRLARYFNQAKEDFATARYLLAVAQLETPRRARLSDRTTYADLLEYAEYGLTPGLAKVAYVTAYNILDKIAVFLKWELGLPDGERAVDFRRVWRRRGEQAIRSEISDKNDPNLLALYDLSIDLQDSDLKLTSMRHAITHRQLVVHDWTVMVGEGSTADEHIELEGLIRCGVNLLQMVKAALVYLAAYLNQDQIRKRIDSSGVIPPLPIVWQHEIRG